MGSLASRRNAIVFSAGWWLLRRRLRQRARAALAAVPGGTAPRPRHSGRLLLLLGVLAGGGYAAWHCGAKRHGRAPASVQLPAESHSPGTT